MGARVLAKRDELQGQFNRDWKSAGVGSGPV
jgi:hypothetical protein